MNKEKRTNKENSFGAIMYWTVGILLVLTMLTTCLVGGLFAKYVISDSFYDSARVASSGIGKMELWEHKAAETYEDSGIYELLTQEKPVTGNNYAKVLPGVDIPKDPFIELELKNAEVSYELYVQVTESNLPETVKYELTSDWELADDSDSANGVYVYKYKGTIDPNFNGKIKILKNDMLYVSEHYVGDGKFSLTFSAYLKQAKTN